MHFSMISDEKKACLKGHDSSICIHTITRNVAQIAFISSVYAYESETY